MSRNPPRYIKLQDFPAHAGNVNCIKIGTKSSGVLVTGGDDKKVNLWTIGAQTKALSLQGHQTPVESVTFDHNEEVVAAGAASGSIKLFDLDQAKVTRAMSGHRSNVLSLELSQYGLLSGSMDTNVKVWDLRGKDMVSQFKGHKAGVTHVKFSPDGKWVASASSDGAVKIWDLVASKLLHELPGHTHAVTGLHFHPVEYLLGTCSADKTIKVWDLESMSLLEQTPPEATGVRAMTFHPDGRHVLSALQDGLRVWAWDPPPCVQQDTVELPWYKVSDMSMLVEKNKLVGCSFNQNFVGLWVVDLKDVRPFNGDLSGASSSAGGGGIGGQRRQSAGPAQLPSSSVGGGVIKVPSGANVGIIQGGGSSSRGGEVSQSADVPGRVKSEPSLQAMPPRSSHGNVGVAPPAGAGGLVGSLSKGRSFPRDPSPSSASDPSSFMVAPIKRNSGGGAREGQGGGRYLTGGVDESSDGGGGGPAQGRHPPPHIPPLHHPHSQGHAPNFSVHAPPPPLPPQPLPPQHVAGSKPGMVSVGIGVGDSLARGQVEPGHLHTLAAQHKPSDRSLPSSQSMPPPPAPAPAPEQYRRPPPFHAPPPLGPVSSSSGPSEIDMVAEISGRHDQTKGGLSLRLHNLQLMRSFLSKGDAKGAISAARRCQDPGSSCDLLNGLLTRRDDPNRPWCNLDVVPELVPVVESVLSLTSERQVQVGMDMASMMYRSFHQIIRDTCSQAGQARVGVDLSFEQRREKCMTAKLSLQSLGTRLAFIARQMGEQHYLSFKAKELSREINTL